MNVSPSTDYSAFASAPPPEALARLSELAASLFSAEVEVDRAEAELEKRKKAVEDLARRTIPEAMGAVGMKEFVTKSGLKIRVRDLVRASISKANLTAAVAWLDANGHGGIVKRKVYVDFPREQEESAKALLALIRAQGFENVAADYSVHSGSLSSWAKERLAEGDAIPLALLGVSQYAEAEIKTATGAGSAPAA